MPWHLKDTRSQFLIWSHLAGATCPWLGSILYHVFMNCGSSPLMYKRLLQIDMFGIWISQSFGKFLYYLYFVSRNSGPQR
ncbi:hypothetical protein WDU94_004153 [Cyamophila willieti]